MSDTLSIGLYILSIVLVGAVIRLVGDRVGILQRPTKIGFRYLNILVLWVVLPTIVFVSIARYTLNEILGFGNAFVLAFIGLGVCFISPVVLSHILKEDRKTTIAVAMNSAFMNVTHLGFPIVYALLGSGGLGPAALYAMGIGVPNLIFGIMLMSSTAKERVKPGFLLENVVTFPAAFALIVALLFVGFGATVPTAMRDFFDVNLAKPFFALMLLLVGYQMRLVSPHRHAGMLATTGAIRFIVCPLVTYMAIVMLGLNLAKDITPMPALILSAMPPAIFNLILAHKYKQDLKLYGAMFFYLTLISLFVVLPVLLWFIS